IGPRSAVLRRRGTRARTVASALVSFVDVRRSPRGCCGVVGAGGHPMKRSLAMTTIFGSEKGTHSRLWLIFGVVAVMSMTGVSAAVAQSVSSGTIEGTVKDESNAVLPGVTVTATSPQLQVGVLTQVSDSAGNYKFVDLPAGTYRLKAEIQGFSTSVREDLRLTVGFNARVDLTLKLGAMEESVTVTGQSPVV